MKNKRVAGLIASLIARKDDDEMAMSPLTLMYWLWRLPHESVGANME